MKKVIYLFLLFIFIGCSPGYDKTTKTDEYRFNYRIIKIDGCQYIAYPTYLSSEVTHKGDCDNPIHYQTKVVVYDTIKVYKLIQE